ncbi:MAG: pyridoxamine 5'-phosphate oxidase family protein [Panacagrimonas sp.]
MNHLPQSTPFHAGELAIQSRLGVQEKIGAFGSRMIRDYLTAQHRKFFPMLPSLFLGSRDASGQMWASILSSAPGFVHAPDARSLRIDTLPMAASPLAAAMQPGARLGVLGLQFESRRRNRASGTVVTTGARGFSLRIHQSFGNCPKYIQTREPNPVQRPPTVVRRGDQLHSEDIALIRRADTFFIASGIDGDADHPGVGNDVSHRGGRPGFVKVAGNALTWPDFIGNFMFNTLGNLALDPRAGLLFLDFERGHTLQLSGTAQVIWHHPAQAQFAGAQRFVRFQVQQVLRTQNGLGLAWKTGEPSPFNTPTGVWET